MAVAHQFDDSPVNIRVGDFELRVAESPAEIEEAQALRYRIFYEEMAAQPTAEMAAVRRDFDSFDSVCDHLLIIDHKLGGSGKVIGTYRILRRSVAQKHGRFYSSDEFDIAPLLAHPGEIMELGRSCIEAEYRSRAAMQLMWRGITAYVMHYEIGLMFGCASLPGVEPEAHAMTLSYLYHHHLAPVELRARALPDRMVSMNQLSLDALDKKAAMEKLPPLIKGYLRLGGFVGDGAVVDHQFHTTDVCIIVKTDWLSDRYVKHYTRGDQPQRPAGSGQSV
jgi:putative hemolysin